MIDTKDKQTGGNGMSKLIIDSKEFEVDSIVKAKFESLEAKLDVAEQRKANVEKLEGERDALKAQIDKLNKEIDEAKKKEVTADALDKRVQDRVDLINKAQKFLGDSVDFTGKSDREIKESVIAKTSPDFKGDGKSDDYIAAYFDSAVANVEKKGFTNPAAFNDAKDKDKEAAEEIEKQKNNRLNMNKKEDK